MLDKLCISERRARIIDYLIVNKQSTYIELAAEFNVTVGTIGRDIEYLSTVAPIILSKEIMAEFTYCLNTEVIGTISQTPKKSVFVG